jgi:hypothetical protein
MRTCTSQQSTNHRRIRRLLVRRLYLVAVSAARTDEVDDQGLDKAAREFAEKF